MVLGGGTGTIAANRLRRIYGSGEAEIVVVDSDDEHVYQPGLLFVPFGLADPGRLVRPRHRQLRPGISFREAGIDRVDLPAGQVHLDDGTALGYDVLVIATGARLLPEETEGLTGPGWMESVFTFYTPDGAAALRGALERFSGGRLVVNVVENAGQVPGRAAGVLLPGRPLLPAPGHPRPGQLSYVTPLDGAFTKPVCNRELSGLLTQRGIELVTEFNTGTVQGRGDGTGGPRLISYDDRQVPFDLAVVVPLHGGAAYVDRSPAWATSWASSRWTGTRCRPQPNQHLRHRRCRGRAHLQGRVGRPLRRRDRDQQHSGLPGRPAGERRLRRPYQLLHRDRGRQGPAGRLQLRHRAATRPLPGGPRVPALTARAQISVCVPIAA